ncbi:MAG: hypothetical protein M3R45_13920 [Pseudomonadota bacterium]|nr:hypothetical protein [Pseudomonadota bacterium]
MKLFSFPQATLEKAIQKRIMTLAPQHRDWFAERWLQKPYKKSFIEKKAMPLVIFLSKGKSWDEADFNEEMAAWDVKFYEAEAEVLYPFVEGDGLLQLMQKNMPAERLQALRHKLDSQRHV